MSLKSIILLSSNVAKSVLFYQKAIGLNVIHQSAEMAELSARNNTSIVIKETTSAAELTHGYSPVLSFQVDDMDTCIVNAMTNGATLDGPILYPLHGKFASIRDPDGQMIGLFEPNRDLNLPSQNR